MGARVGGGGVFWEENKLNEETFTKYRFHWFSSAVNWGKRPSFLPSFPRFIHTLGTYTHIPLTVQLALLSAHFFGGCLL